MSTYKYLDKDGLAYYHSKIETLLNGKVNTEAGKGLSTNDYTTTEKNKLAGIATGAEVNVNADWNASSGDAQILNKPTKLSDFTNDSGFITSSALTPYVQKGGSTMTGQLKTSFKEGVAIGSFQVSSQNIPAICEELRYSSGGMGSFSINTAYTKNDVTIPTGWYNFLWIPHRSGGVNGQASGDNCNYGTMIIGSMNFTGNTYRLQYSSGSVVTLTKLDTPSNVVTNATYYLNTHPENSPVIIPFINNDIAFLLSRGGNIKVYYDNVEQQNPVNVANLFDGSPNYWTQNPTNITEIKMELTLHRTFSWGNNIYCDFGNVGWRAKHIKIEVMNTNYASDVWTTKLDTNNDKGNIFCTVSHTPVGADNAGGGFNKIRFTFTNWNNATNFRIAQLGVYNYSSLGSRETSMSRGIDDYVFRNITPNSNNTYNLGSSSNKWANVYATTFTGTATKATGDKNGADITTTYQKKLTAGTNITIDANNVISAEGGGSEASVIRMTQNSYDTMYNGLINPTGYSSELAVFSAEPSSYSNDYVVDANLYSDVLNVANLFLNGERPQVFLKIGSGTISCALRGFMANSDGTGSFEFCQFPIENGIDVPTISIGFRIGTENFITIAIYANFAVYDMYVNGNSIGDWGYINLVTNSAYDADTNPIATMADVGGITLEDVYPVGSIYMSVTSTSPATLFGFGTWQQIKDTFLLSAGDTYTAGSTGGEATHTLTVDEMPSHSHKWYSSGSTGTVANSTRYQGSGKNLVFNTDPAGGGLAHNNMPPYLTVYMWKRTA